MTGVAMLDRRRLLALLAALPASRAAAALGADDDLAVFRDIVHAVGGVALLPPPLLAGCEHEFARAFGPRAIPELAALARKRRSVDALVGRARMRVGDQLHWIARFLYTGETAAGAVYYPWCLGWQALSFASAPGQCAGRMGHWAGPHP